MAGIRLFDRPDTDAWKRQQCLLRCPGMPEFSRRPGRLRLHRSSGHLMPKGRLSLSARVGQHHLSTESDARITAAADQCLGSVNTILPRSGGFAIVGVGYSRGVPMSKVPIFASFDFAEILMLTASILVVAAITFVF